MRSLHRLYKVIRPSLPRLPYQVQLWSSIKSFSYLPIQAKYNLKFTPRPSCRHYASGGGHVSLTDTEQRVLGVLKNFDKVDSGKLSLATPFTQLGLDSLDVVEVMIALEEEFHMEIPDAVADKVQTPKEVTDYIYNFLNPHQPPKPDRYSEDTNH